ncbi:MAG: hypothetical protein KAS32_07530 [Candidatus Peribacteraceae bacterium]|nr:hypothetical protein [Candidatus Peribacteraceae bacterium]
MKPEWIAIIIFAIGLIFNSGVLYNDVRHLKKTMDDMWSEINEIKKILIERKKE